MGNRLSQLHVVSPLTSKTKGLGATNGSTGQKSWASSLWNVCNLTARRSRWLPMKTGSTEFRHNGAADNDWPANHKQALNIHLLNVQKVQAEVLRGKNTSILRLQV